MAKNVYIFELLYLISMMKFQILLGSLFFLQAIVAETVRMCQGSKPIRWTKWYDRDDPSGKGDYETLDDLKKTWDQTCQNVVAVECQTVGGIPADKTGQTVVFNPSVGCLCINADQPDKICNYDYRARFGCCYGCIQHQTSYWTEWFDRDDPSGNGDYETLSDLRKQGKQICERPIDARCQTVEGQPLYMIVLDRVEYSPQVGCYCINADQRRGSCSYDYKVKFKCCK